MTVKLVYVGRGDALIHVPARDLTDEDYVERAELWKEHGINEAALIKSGLYEKPKFEQPKKSKAAKEGE